MAMRSQIVYVVLAGLFGALASWIYLAETPGIIAHEGYPHAVLLCGDGALDGSREEIDEAVLVHHEVGYLVVNTGHEHDPEVGELVEFAKRQCPR